MVFGYFRYLLSSRRKIFSLRKKYNRTREKAIKIASSEKRMQVLRMLDQVEPTLVMLEEQRVSGFEKGRMRRYVESGIKQAKSAMKQKYTAYPAQPYQRPMQRPLQRPLRR